MGVAEQLGIGTRREDDRVVMRLAGELDMASAPQLRGAIEELELGERSLLVLDLQDLSFIDSTGLRVILWAHERCSGAGNTLALTPGSQQVQRLLAISGAAERLCMLASADELP
jgi:anti-sigma B factor antagonist